MANIANLANTIWEFNDEIINSYEATLNFTFSTFFNTYVGFLSTNSQGIQIKYQLEDESFITVYDEENGWYKNDYKTITFLDGTHLDNQTFIEWLEENATLKWSATIASLSELSITSISNLEIWERLYNAKTLDDKQKNIAIMPPNQNRLQLSDVLWEKMRYDTGTLSKSYDDYDIADATETESTIFFFGPRITSDSLFGTSGIIDRDHRYTATFSWNSTVESFEFLKGMYIQKKVLPTDSSTTMTYIPLDATISIVTDGSTKTLKSDKWERYNNISLPVVLERRFFPAGIDPMDEVNNETDEWKSFNNLARIFSDRPRIQLGYYIGNGGMGEESACELQFDFRPKMLMVYGNTFSASNHCYGPLILGENQRIAYNNDMFSSDVTASLQQRWLCVPWINSDLTTVKWWSTVSGSHQMNSNNKMYYYLAIG